MIKGTTFQIVTFNSSVCLPSSKFNDQVSRVNFFGLKKITPPFKSRPAPPSRSFDLTKRNEVALS